MDFSIYFWKNTSFQHNIISFVIWWKIMFKVSCFQGFLPVTFYKFLIFQYRFKSKHWNFTHFSVLYTSWSNIIYYCIVWNIIFYNFILLLIFFQGDITQKGYDKKRSRLLDQYIQKGKYNYKYYIVWRLKNIHYLKIYRHSVTRHEVIVWFC